MLSKLVGAGVLLALAAAGQKADENRTVQLNGGLQAQILSLGRDSSTPRPVLTAAIKISNTGQNHAFVMLYGEPSAIDDAGGKFEPAPGAVSGIAYCGVVPAGLCVGMPRPDDHLYPLEGYTEIDPGKSITMHLTLFSQASKGDRVSISASMAYRLVSDPVKDADLSDKEKLKLLKRGTLSFEPLKVTEK